MGYLENLMGKNEKIVFTTRQHWITIVGSLLVNSFLSLLLIGIGVAVSLLAAFLGPFAWLPIAAMAVVCVAPLWRLFSDWLHWWNDIYVVTNRRIIQAQGVINKHVIDSSLEKINDVVLSQSALGRLLGYGDLEILTGSEIGVNLLKRIADPVLFKTEMLNQKEGMNELDAFEARAKRTLTAEAPSAGDIPELIAELDELRKKGLITSAEFEAKKAKLLAQI
jgi:uncharacterized membrane protein YdbT with pleckstrin-like domain